MKKIINWTFGSFFRTIGRTLAFILFGILFAYVLSKLNLKIPFMSVKALKITYGDMGNYSFNLPQNCNYFYIYTQYGDSYLVCSEDKGYLVEDPGNPNIGNSYYYLQTKLYILEEQYNAWHEWANQENKTGANPLALGGIGYYDNIANEYYEFLDTLNVKKYKITFNQDYTTSFSYNSATNAINGARILASNIDYYGYSQNGYNKPQNIHYAPYNVEKTKITFHLNGGIATYKNSPGGTGPYRQYQEDFSKEFYNNNELDEYLKYLNVEKDVAVFNQWYYDEALTQPYNSNNEINSNIDLYASYTYTSISSIIDNINFNEYTFTDDYEYAVISTKENFSNGLYLALGYNFQNINIYNYNIVNDEFSDQAILTLSSIGSKNGKYYYNISNFNLEDSKIIVLDKADLIKLNANDELVHYYTFWLSDNAYVYFTNDLTRVSYYIPTNNGTSTLLENKDISASYDNTKQIELNLQSNSDIISIFRDIIKDKDMTIFEKFTSMWYKFKLTKLSGYFFLIMLGSIIILVVKSASRK